MFKTLYTAYNQITERTVNNHQDSLLDETLNKNSMNFGKNLDQEYKFKA